MQTKCWSGVALVCLLVVSGMVAGWSLEVPDTGTSGLRYARGAGSVLNDAGLAPQDAALRFKVRAGDVFIMALPDSVSAQPVVTYRIVRAPALSSLYERSYFWRTQTRDAGEHALLFEASFKDTPPDTVEVHVTVE